MWHSSCAQKLREASTQLKLDPRINPLGLKKKRVSSPQLQSAHWLDQLKSAWDSKKEFSKVCYGKQRASLGSGCYRPLTHIQFFPLNGMVIDQSEKIYRKRYCCHVFKACVSQPSLQMESPKQHILDLNVTV